MCQEWTVQRTAGISVELQTIGFCDVLKILELGCADAIFFE